MQRTTRWGLALLMAGTMGFLPTRAGPALAKDNPADLAARLARETNPVKKAKLEIRLSGLKLQAARDARDQDQVEASLQLLQEYHRHVVNAWDWLQKSGRVPLAHKKPDGFKELDIALRQDLRFLEDLKHAYTLAERVPIERIVKDVERIRNEVLEALFPMGDGSGR
jgi:hypothetical protein